MSELSIYHLDKLPEEQKQMWRENAAAMNMKFNCPSSEEPRELAEELSEARIVIVNKTKLTEEMLASAKNLQLVQIEGRLENKVPAAELKRRGIPIAEAGLPSTIAVAEHALALILACAKKIVPAHEMTKTGAYRGLGIEPKTTTERSHGFQWMKIEGLVELNGLKLGIFGYGEIGNEIALRLKPFNMEIFYHKRSRFDKGYEEKLGIEYLDKDELFKTADVIVLNSPLTPETQNAVSEHELSLMKNSAILVNVSRGGVVDEPALVKALREKQIACAGLDVFVEEPVPYDHPYLSLNNIVLTPHIAGGKGGGRIRNIQTVLGSIKDSIAHNE